MSNVRDNYPAVRYVDEYDKDTDEQCVRCKGNCKYIGVIGEWACQGFTPMTNYDRIISQTPDGLANQLVSEQYVAMKMVFTLLCQKLEDEEILDEKEAKECFCDFENEVKKRWGEMVKEKLEWLKSQVGVDDG